MKKTLETSSDKMQEICDVLRKKTLEPAKEEAQNIIEDAKSRADKIVHDAEKHAEQIVQDARKSIEQEKNVFHSSLAQAGKQGIEALRQSIENTLFNRELNQAITKQTADPKVIANLISAVVSAIEKEGISADLTAIIPKTVPAKDVTQYLADGVMSKLKSGGIVAGDIAGGAKVRLEGKNIVIDISDKEIEDIVRGYVRKDFRKLLFGSKGEAS